MDKKTQHNLTDQETKTLRFVDSLRIEKVTLEKIIKEENDEVQIIQNRKITLENEVLVSEKKLEEIKIGKFSEKESAMNKIDEIRKELSVKADDLKAFSEKLEKDKIDFEQVFNTETENIKNEKAQIEDRISSLKKREEDFHAEELLLVDLKENLGKRKVVILEKESLSSQREFQLNEREAGIEESNKNSDRRNKKIEERVISLDNREKEISVQEENLNAKQRIFEDRITGFDTRLSEAQQKEKELEKKEKELTEKEQGISEKLKSLDFKALELRSAAQDLARREKTVVIKERLNKE